MSDTDSGISPEAWAAYYRWIEEEGANLDRDLAFVAGWHARDEEVVRERARAEAAWERIRELEGVIWTAAYLERAHEVQKYIHKAWRNIEILRESHAADPPTPTGEASGAGEG